MDKAYRKDLCKRPIEAVDYFQENVTGELDSDDLLPFIRIARKDKRLQPILNIILDYASAETINDAIFDVLMQFPSRQRLCYAIILSHLALPYYQLCAINAMIDQNGRPVCTEAFAQLFICICKHDCFSKWDLKKVIESGHVNKSVLHDCCNHAVRALGVSEKLQFAITYCEAMQDTPLPNADDFRDNGRLKKPKRFRV